MLTNLVFFIILKNVPKSVKMFTNLKNVHNFTKMRVIVSLGDAGKFGQAIEDYEKKSPIATHGHIC